MTRRFSLAIGRARLPRVLAVLAAVGFSGFMLIYAAGTGNHLAVPGAASATLLYAVLGYLALRGRDWARWIFFCLVLLTTLVCLVGTFFDLSGPRPRVDFTPTLAGVTLVYALIAVGLAMPAAEDAR